MGFGPEQPDEAHGADAGHPDGGLPPRSRPAYLWSRRTQACYDVAVTCALATAAIVILGAVSPLAGLTSMVDIAQSAVQAVRPGLLNAIGPIIVLLALPVYRGGLRVTPPADGHSPGPIPVEAISPGMLVRQGLHWRLSEPTASARVVRFSFRGRYWARTLVTVTGWAAGLAVLVLALGSVPTGYTVSPGAFLLGMLESLGLLAAALMLPARLPKAEVSGQPTQRATWVSRVATR